MTTKEALDKSIEVWKRRRNATLEQVSEDFLSYKPEVRNCPLCNLFHEYYTGRLETCIGCPVNEKTGLPRCVGSPYEKADDAFELYFSYDSTEENKNLWHQAADEMIEFLESLGVDDE